MADETFSFRWGIPLLDDGHTTIPNFVLDNYAQAGVTRAEFLVIVHLARYQFERPGATCKPSVGTVAQQMGCSERTLQRTLAGLESKGLLKRQYRNGETTIYNFRGFSRAVLRVASSGGGDTGVTPDKNVTPDTVVTQRIKSHDNDNHNPRGDGVLAHVVALYTAEIGKVTPRVQKRLQALVGQYPDIRRWEAAFDGVVKSNIKRLDYLTRCLENVGKPHYAKPR